MIIPCIRCGKGINSPNSSNADYVIADEFIVKERIPKYVTIPKTQDEIDSGMKSLRDTLEVYRVIASTYEADKIEPRGITVEDVYGEIEAIEEEIAIGVNPDKTIVMRGKLEDVQKTGVVCPDCYEPTDTVIWGVHKVAQ